MYSRLFSPHAVLGGALALSACVGTRPAPSPAPAPVRIDTQVFVPDAPPRAPTPSPRTVLTAFPKVTGPLALDMVYPPDGHLLTVRESTFVFGSVGNGDASLTINNAPVRVNPNGSFMAFLPVPADTAYTMRASLPTGETAVAVRRVRFPTRSAPARPTAPATIDEAGYPRLVTLANTNPDATADTDMVTIARPTPTGTYQWFLLPGTVVQATGRMGNGVRVRLDSQLEAWVDAEGIAGDHGPAAAAPTGAESAAAGADGTSMRVHRISAARVASFDGYSDIVLSMDARAPYDVEQALERLSLTVYNARASIDIIRYDTNDPTVRLLRHEQVSNDRVRFDVDLRHPSVGYLVFWRSGSLVLRVRHVAHIDATAPLRGRVIAVDPGHPPAGAMGPTRLREPEATLAVAQQLKALLEERGARVVMMRTTMDPVALYGRPILARRENVEAFVSIHLNAFADGANPYAAARGSGTFFFFPQSEPLARAVQQGLVRNMGLRDEGVFFNNLAVARATWFPAVLCEGAWVVMPEQEAALRTTEFQRAYAMGIVEGLEAYFRGLVAR